MDSKLDETQVMNESNIELRPFWNLLQYRYGLPLSATSNKIQKLGEDNISNIHYTGFLSIAISTLICCPSIKMPDTNIYLDPDSRLSIYLLLANDALEKESNINAVRNYYIILEDIYLECSDGGKSLSQEIIELKHVRDFISHSKITRNRKLLDFLAENLGDRIDSYDPSDINHQNLVKKYRNIGFRLVEQEINKLIKKAENNITNEV